jgi:hypothetical protein
MALLGGLAMAVWKHPRNTRDVDVLVDVTNIELGKLLDSVAQAGMKLKRQPPVLQIGNQRIIQLLYQSAGSFLDIQIDLLLADGDYQKAALARRVPAKLPGCAQEIAVLSCEDLIIHKLLAGRIIDRADVAALLRLNRQGLDLAYLRAWLTPLQLLADFDLVWQEAFPGEKPPGSAVS